MRHCSVVLVVLAACAPSAGPLPVDRAAVPQLAQARTWAASEVAERVDADADGFADVLVSTSAGWMLHRGGVDGPEPTPSAAGSRREPPQYVLRFVRDVTVIGDVDGDGAPELAIGEANTSNGESYWGSVQVLTSDGSGGWRELQVLERLPDGHSVDVPVSLASGDFDGDERVDLLWASPDEGHDTFASKPREESCLDLAAGDGAQLAAASHHCEHRNVPRGLFEPPGQLGTGLGRALSTGADPLGLGHASYITSTSCAATLDESWHAGFDDAELVVGDATHDVRLSRRTDPSLPSCFGADVTSAPDLDLDGHDDVVATTPTGLLVFFGPDLAARRVVEVSCSSTGVSDGCRVAAIGDLDGDGYGDLAVSRPTVVEVYSGSPWGVVPGPMLSMPKVGTGDLADEVKAAGDVDGDGLADLFVQTPGSVVLVTGRPVDDHDGDGVVDPDDCAPWDPTRSAPTGATEVVGDDVDDDCDGTVTCHVDEDHDGIGAAATTTVAPRRDACSAEGLAPIAGDCDDADPSVHPDVDDPPGDGVDQDCDGSDAQVVDTDTDDSGAPDDTDVDESDAVPADTEVPGDSEPGETDVGAAPDTERPDTDPDDAGDPADTDPDDGDDADEPPGGTPVLTRPCGCVAAPVDATWVAAALLALARRRLR